MSVDPALTRPLPTGPLPISPTRAPPTLLRVTLGLGAAYWFATFITDSIVWGIAGVDPIKSAGGKLFACALGALACFAISYLLFRLRRRSLLVQAAICFAAALLAAPLFALLDYRIYVFYKGAAAGPIVWADFGRTMVSFTANFFGWSCLFVALLYSRRMREQEQRLAATREEALAAQMRALRYQINPHFLFNTLNSIAALIGEGQPRRAERMVLLLSEFLHETLRRDPTHDLRLEEELSVQLAYLDIERERFPDRILVAIHVPDELRGLLVPSLILQPLIENAVKHGVNAAAGPTAITISAATNDGKLTVRVENDLPAAPPTRPVTAGFGIGLRNVAERIAARFGDEGTFAAAPAAGRFAATLTIPARSS